MNRCENQADLAIVGRSCSSAPGPEGHHENSPAFQRWGDGNEFSSPEGTVEVGAASSISPSTVPSGLCVAARNRPSVETLGYCQASLRDKPQQARFGLPKIIGVMVGNFMKWTEDKLDVLQNLEFSIVEVWRAHPEMTDHVARRAYEAAFQLYRAEQRGHEPKPPTLTGLDAVAFESLQAMCEFRLGRRADLFPDAGNIPPIPVEQMVDYLRELAKSVERHTKLGGRQGYLTFIDKFLP